MSHQRALEMRVRVVLTCLMMTIVESRRRQLLEPYLEVVDEPTLPIVDVHGRGDVHCRDEDHPFLHAPLLDDGCDLVGDANELLPLLRVEPEILSCRRHSFNEAS